MTNISVRITTVRQDWHVATVKMNGRIFVGIATTNTKALNEALAEYKATL